MRRGVAVAVAVGSLLVAASVYVPFWYQADHLWWSIHHDRNAHYVTALQLATSLRQFNLFLFVKHLVALTVWPPGGYLLPALVLTAAGYDIRWAVLPNALSWAASAWLAFAIAKRCLPSGGSIAGVIAALLVLASPIHRGFAVDLMLESTGVFLTLLCLHAYLIAVQTDTTRSWAWLGASLTALLITKYNYWLMVLLALGGTEAVRRANDYALWALSQVRFSFHSRDFLSPWNLSLLLFALAVAVVALLQPPPVWGVRLSPPTNAFWLLYVLFLVRLAKIYWGTLGQLDPRAAALVYWHVVPAALFMALPRHITTFLWYVSPWNGPHSDRTMFDGIEFYSRALLAEYHPTAMLAWIALAGFLLGLIFASGLRPGSAAVFTLALLGAFLVCKHPNQQERFACTWVPVAWIGSALGMMGLASVVASRWRQVALIPCLFASAAVITLLIPHVVDGRRSRLAGPRVEVVSQAELARVLVKEAQSEKRVMILASTPVRFLAEWAFLQAEGSTQRLEGRWFGFRSAGRDNVEGFRQWLEKPTCERILTVEVPGETTDPEVEMLVAPHRELLPVLRSSSAFQLRRLQLVAGFRVGVYERFSGLQVAR
ncbi:MAG: glycosyltransferase family 39 protein [Gemmataceae bacterium]